MNKKDFFYLLISKLRFPILLLVSVYSISIFGLVFIEGTDSEGNPYNLSYFDALFVVIYTSTTVGFGEIPYQWNLPQKTWMAFVVISSVTAWLISIGRIVSILQDPHIKNQTKIYFFKRKMKKINEDFFIISGYGRVGSKIVDLMYKHGLNSVVIDKNPDIIRNLKNNHNENVFAIYGDVSDLDYLRMLGIESKFCKGIIMATGDDDVNTKASLASKILNNKVNVVSRANCVESLRNMKSFKTDHIISKHRLFSDKILNTIYSEKYNIIESTLTNESFSFKYVTIPDGRWVILGFNNFGKILYKELNNRDYKFAIIDERINKEKYKTDNFIQGNGVDSIDLNQANVQKSNVIVANHGNDFTNLSSIMTAKLINPSIFSIAVLNDSKNKILFENAEIDFIIEPYELMVRKIFSIISEPLVSEFLNKIKNDKELTEKIYEKINLLENNNSVVWNIKVDSMNTPAIIEHLNSGGQVRLLDICPEDKYLHPLLIRNEKTTKILPEKDDFIYRDDIILFISNKDSRNYLEYIVENYSLFNEIIKA